ncbi:MAG: triple tyrosine motif-containing protein [Blastocatellia bacterium]
MWVGRTDVEDSRGGIGTRLDRTENLQVRESIELPQIATALKLAFDTAGGIWLGLTNGDLVRYRNGRMETFPALEGSKSGTRALAAESDGSILAATQGGLLRWKEGASRLLASLNGLPRNDIYTMVNDGAGSLWLYAKCGAITLPAAELEKWRAKPDDKVYARVFDAFDGDHPSLSPKQSRSIDVKPGFANESLLQMIGPAHLGVNQLPPPVHIELIVADRKSYSAGGYLDLPPLTRDLEIDYTALSLVIPQKVRYRYKLEGHDQDWQEPGTRREAFYNDLPPPPSPL